MRKKIAFVVATPFTATAFLMKHFEVLATEYDIYLIANFENFDKTAFKNISNISLHHLPIVRSINLFHDVKSLILLYKYLNKMKFDSVHSVTPKAGLIAMVASKMANVNKRIHIFTGQVWHTKKGLFKRILMFLDKVIASCATHVLVDGNSQKQYLIDNHIITDKNSLVLGKGSISGVDISKFSPNAIKKEETRQKLHYKNSDVVFLFLGRLNTDKGILDLAKAFQKIQVEYSNARLLFVGPDEENLQAQIEQIISNKVSLSFVGFTKTPQDYLQAADVFCLPSYREGFGTSVIEASLMNLPIICSDTYGLMDTIVDNKTGIRHKVKDENSIYEAMKKLLLAENLRVSFGESGANYVKSNFSAEYVSAEWLQFYKNLLQ